MKIGHGEGSFKIGRQREFPGGPVVGTPYFHCRGPQLGN